MSEFTKGEWEVVFAGPSPIGVGIARKGDGICTLYDMLFNPVFKGKTDADVPQIIKDLTLAASAPAIYAELKASNNRLQTVINSVLTDSTDDRRRNIETQIGFNNKALSQARGEEVG